MSKITTSLLFDMRAPAFGAPRGELYAAALNMAQFADEIGVATINLMEHHGSEDGYLPQPFVLGGGIAARTRNCRLVLGAVVLPLHDPVKVAEQIAVLDIMSQGRLNVTIGAGYVPSEFAAFGATLRDRGRLVDEGIAIIPVMTKGGAIGIVGYGAGLPGGFGEFMLLDEDFLLEVPADLDSDLAALIEAWNTRASVNPIRATFASCWAAAQSVSASSPACA